MYRRLTSALIARASSPVRMSAVPAADTQLSLPGSRPSTTTDAEGFFLRFLIFLLPENDSK